MRGGDEKRPELLKQPLISAIDRQGDELDRVKKANGART